MKDHSYYSATRCFFHVNFTEICVSLEHSLQGLQQRSDCSCPFLRQITRHETNETGKTSREKRCPEKRAVKNFHTTDLKIKSCVTLYRFHQRFHTD